MKVRLFKLAGVTVALSIIACGVNERTFKSAEKKIADLKNQGVMDSSLSTTKVLLYQAKDAQQRGNIGLAKKTTKQMKREIAAVEATFRETVNRLMPKIDSLRSVIRATRSGLSGLQLKKLDSMMVSVDSLLNKKWYLAAYTKIKEIGDMIPQFNKDEERARELGNIIPGEWVCTNVTKSKDVKGVYAVEKKIFTFNRDNTVLLVENKKGQSGPFLKEDWEYKSWGKYDLHGDTIHLFINRFAAVRQNFERLYFEDGGKKKVWKKEINPTYDSLITDGSQDRYVIYTDLKEDFVQTKKF